MFEDKQKSALVICGVVVAAQFYFFIKNTFLFPLKKAKDEPLQCEEDVCIEPIHLHVFPGSYPTVSLSLYSSKIVLYCRLAGIPYTVSEAHSKMDSMSKGKVPFAVHAGKIIQDSQLIIRYLENTFDVASMAKKVPAMFQSKSKPFICYDLLDEKQKVSEYEVSI